VSCIGYFSYVTTVDQTLTISDRPYFNKAEHFYEPTEKDRALLKLDGEEGTNDYQVFPDAAASVLGKSGPIQITYGTTFAASHSLAHKAYNTLGIDTNQSHLSGTSVGAWTSLATVDPVTRKRSYAIRYVQDPKPNLHILTEALVQEIIIEDKDDNGLSATGVRFTYKDGKEYIVPASKEVILSAGSIQSPQILELSGVGNPDVLAKAGVQVKYANKNVGENLQDHISKPT